jgi:hypothetical protein
MNNELEKFIQETLRQIEAGTLGHTNMGDVDFEIAIAKTVTKDGHVDIKVLGVGGEIKTENVSKVKFSTRLKGAWNKISPSPWNA